MEIDRLSAALHVWDETTRHLAKLMLALGCQENQIRRALQHSDSVQGYIAFIEDGIVHRRNPVLSQMSSPTTSASAAVSTSRSLARTNTAPYPNTAAGAYSSSSASASSILIPRSKRFRFMFFGIQKLR